MWYIEISRIVGVDGVRRRVGKAALKGIMKQTGKKRLRERKCLWKMNRARRNKIISKYSRWFQAYPTSNVNHLCTLMKLDSVNVGLTNQSGHATLGQWHRRMGHRDRGETAKHSLALAVKHFNGAGGMVLGTTAWLSRGLGNARYNIRAAGRYHNQNMTGEGTKAELALQVVHSAVCRLVQTSTLGPEDNM
jgi:hypothetical protein